jgi:hypothetical protein
MYVSFCSIQKLYPINGTFGHNSQQLVAKGFYQHARIDYSETYSLVIKPTTVSLVLSIAILFGWSFWQINIQNAFLHDHLYEKYICPNHLDIPIFSIQTMFVTLKRPCMV